MKKLDMKTQDLTEENIEKLSALFPGVITEIEKDGKLIKTVNVEALKELIGDYADKNSEVYELTWAGKQKARRASTLPTTNTLRPVLEDSVDFENTENLYIEGDNLEVLKILRNSYTKKVKIIFIDPPYNRKNGSDLIYIDDFSRTKKEEEIESGNLDEKENRLIKNTGADGKFHSNWLNFMYPRLQLAHKLLEEDGVIFVSIDDDEVHNLRNIMDEIFGENNFITQFVWEKTQHFGRQKVNFYSNMDYILCYSKKLHDVNKKELLVEYIKKDLEDAPLYNDSNNISSLTFPKNSVKFNINDGIYSNTADSKYCLLEDVIVKNGTNFNDLKLKFKSRWSQSKIDSELSLGTSFWVKTQNFAIRAVYNKDKISNESPKQLIFTNKNNPLCAYSRFGFKVGTNEEATEEIKNYFSSCIFSYPKPSSLIKYLISIVYDYTSKNFKNDFIILDFFSGSSSTADAVMQLNAEDGGNRKYIMVQLSEEVKEGTEAFTSGYKNICEIGKERIRRAAKKIKEDNKDKDLSNVDFGFRVFKLDSSIYKENRLHPDKVAQENLYDYTDSIKSNVSNDEILYSVLLTMGVPISAKIETRKIQNKKVFIVNEGWLVACFDDSIDLDLIKELSNLGSSIKNYKTKYVFRESSFKDDSAMINCMEYLKSKIFKSDGEFKSNVKLI